MVSHKKVGVAALAGVFVTFAGVCAAQQATAPAPSASLPTVQDRLFMLRAAAGNLAEIQTGQLALKNAGSAQVKQVAQTIITDHTQAQTQLTTLAAAKQVILPDMPGVADMAMYDKLKKAKGADFDKLYLSGQVEDHENTVALFQQEAAMGQDADVKAFEAQTLPHIIGHTQTLYQAAMAVAAPGAQMRARAGVSMFPVPGGMSMDSTTAPAPAAAP